MSSEVPLVEEKRMGVGGPGGGKAVTDARGAGTKSFRESDLRFRFFLGDAPASDGDLTLATV